MPRMPVLWHRALARAVLGGASMGALACTFAITPERVRQLVHAYAQWAYPKLYYTLQVENPRIGKWDFRLPPTLAQLRTHGAAFLEEGTRRCIAHRVEMTRGESH